ncbi:MAG: hypothetical protein GY760_07310 [Deltaproteobacteria bacterium]|nr:hypothetical protein [Deltaproteobacteria bacterium]
MKYGQKAINAYKSASTGETSKKGSKTGIKKDKRKKNNDTSGDDRIGFLKLTKENADYTKIAKFLLLLGKDEAVKVVKHLSPVEVEKISKEISLIKRVDRLEAEILLREFGFDKEKEAVRVRGGAEIATEILTKAFGKKESDRLLRKAAPESIEGPFSFLNDLDLNQLTVLMKDESIQVTALILRYLDPKLSSQLIKAMGREKSTAVIKRIAGGGSVSSEVIAGMENSLKEKIRNQGKVESEDIDGPSALAGILKYMDIGAEQKILESLSGENPDLSRDIKEKLFTIDTVLHIDRNDLQKVLNELSERDIVMLLRRADNDVKDKIRNSISSHKLMLIDEEDIILGPVKKTSADIVVKDFLNLLKKREEEGAFIVLREEDEYV